MPQIKEYTPRSEVAGPVGGRRASSEDFGGGAGLYKAGGAILELGEVVEKRNEQAEISDLHAKMAKAHEDFTTNLADAVQRAQPGDQTLVQNFRQSFDDYMGKLEENISTNAGSHYFQRTKAELEQHFMERAFSGQMELAGKKAVQDHQVSLNALSTSLMKDPASFDMAVKMYDDQVKNLVDTQHLPSEKAAELRTQSVSELAKSAVRGWISLNPEDAQKQLQNGKWNGLVSGDTLHQLYGEAQVAINAREAQIEKARKDQEKALQAAQKQTQDGFIQKMVDGSLNTDEIMKSNLNPVGEGSKQWFIDKIRDEAKAKSKTDPATFNELFRRIHLPDGDPKKIVDANELNAAVGNGLDFHDFKQLREEVDGTATPEGRARNKLMTGMFEQARTMLTKSKFGIPDPIGDQQMQAFTAFALDSFKKGKAAGKSDADLLNPASKDYIGHSITRFIRSSEDKINDTLRLNGIAPPGEEKKKAVEPKQAGESPADYLKRIGK